MRRVLRVFSVLEILVRPSHAGLSSRYAAD
jgi:hypothetical protein